MVIGDCLKVTLILFRNITSRFRIFICFMKNVNLSLIWTIPFHFSHNTGEEPIIFRVSDNILPMAVAFSAVDLMGSTTISPKVRKDFPETWIWELFPDLGLVYPVFYGFISLGRSLLLSLLHSFICK